ncbi:MAG: MAPEG family protein [Porticoccaceae bacterium]
MTEIIIYTLALALVQIWLLPMSLNMKNFGWLLSSRDEPIETSVMQQRVERARDNLQASLAPFLTMCLLSMHMDVDITTAATYWLGLRIIYVPLYMSGTSLFRSLVWIGSLVCMIYMAMQLI